MKKLLLWLALRFRWKSKLWADIFLKDYKKAVQKAIDDIDLDTSDIKVVRVRLPKCPQEGKTSYSEQIAKQEAVKMEKRNLTMMRAYKCMFCPHWHLTHKKSKLQLH